MIFSALAYFFIQFINANSTVITLNSTIWYCDCGSDDVIFQHFISKQFYMGYSDLFILLQNS